MWCQGTARADQVSRYPYDPADTDYKYDPAEDDYEGGRYIDANGYPEMIDPATGLEWGMEPGTDQLYNGLTWPAAEPDDLDERYNPLHDTDIDYGDNPATPGTAYGIDPSTGEIWHNNIIDSTGTITNAVEETGDEGDPDPPIGGGDNTPNLEPCDDPENTYRPAGSDECIQCDSGHCDNWPPPCENDDYRPEGAALNDFGYIDCVPCDTASCPDFVIPECDTG